MECADTGKRRASEDASAGLQGGRLEWSCDFYLYSLG